MKKSYEWTAVYHYTEDPGIEGIEPIVDYLVTVNAADKESAKKKVGLKYNKSVAFFDLTYLERTDQIEVIDLQNLITSDDIRSSNGRAIVMAQRKLANKLNDGLRKYNAPGRIKEGPGGFVYIEEENK